MANITIHVIISPIRSGCLEPYRVFLTENLAFLQLKPVIFNSIRARPFIALFLYAKIHYQLFLQDAAGSARQEALDSAAVCRDKHFRLATAVERVTAHTAEPLNDRDYSVGLVLKTP